MNLQNDVERINSLNLSPRAGKSRSKGHRVRVRKEKFKRDLKCKCFTQRMVGIYNELPEKVKETDTTT